MTLAPSNLVYAHDPKTGTTVVESVYQAIYFWASGPSWYQSMVSFIQFVSAFVLDMDIIYFVLPFMKLLYVFLCLHCLNFQITNRGVSPGDSPFGISMSVDPLPVRT
jgi:hypothetical protein